MSPKVDSAILRALSLDPTTASIFKHGGSGFASTFKINGAINGDQKLFFVKTGGMDSEEMFTGMAVYTDSTLLVDVITSS